MSFPTAFFLDTSVLDGQHYNFASTAFAAFVPVAREKKLLFLLPDPTKREVMRHMSERSATALQALEDARRRAPFLRKWRFFPNLPESKWNTDWEVKRVATEEWNQFLSQFSVKELGYEAVRLNTVMNWYDDARPPFGGGKKRKEFPDAFAIAALAEYAQETKTYVAVVAADQDFKGACEYSPYLLYFPSLAALTELLLADEKAVQTVRELVLKRQDMLEEAAAQEAETLNFYVHGDADIEDFTIDHVSIGDVHVVGLGSRECTIAFEGTVEFEVRLTRRRTGRYGYGYGYAQEYEYDYFHPVEGQEAITGTAKLQISDDRTKIEKVTYIELDTGEIELSEPSYWRA